jgi:hypothetical protein
MMMRGERGGSPFFLLGLAEGRKEGDRFWVGRGEMVIGR